MARKGTRGDGARDPLAPLEEIAGNLWWSWNPQAQRLFAWACAAGGPPAVDGGVRAWAAGLSACDNNPAVALRRLSAARRRALAADAGFMREMRRVHAELRRYLRAKTWLAGTRGRKVRGVTAYFCMEYAEHESLPFYAGGLGVLAGDHLKSASDLGLPFVAVGIYWKKGYTRQHIDRTGRQTDEFRTLRPEDTPLTEVTRAGKPLRLTIPMGPDLVVARAWRMDVGRVPLYLLDTDLPANKPKDRRLTHVLYSGDRDTRIRQEILLGIGGWRLLRALGVDVRACHLNEGHAAFLSLERIAERMEQKGATFAEAKRYVAATSVFTTHTPVPAGNEEFDPRLVDRYFAAWPRRLGITHRRFHDLARVKPGDARENYGMTPLALRTSRYANGVAALHGKIARGMWKDVFPKARKAADVPIGHVTNGIHLRTWLHPRMAELYDEVLGADWAERQDDAAAWAACRNMPDEALWALHRQFKEELISFCRARLKGQMRRSPVRGMSLGDVDRVLDPDALTIGFARRFAPYKRATLCFHDAARFAKLLNDRKRPVQIIFAGKAHPADEAGKAIIAELVRYSRMPKFRRRVVFLEDYEMQVARYLVAGVDVWLNNPQRPREASGTSGMKPALHGGLNLSILDGWWPEGFNGKNGWAIGTGKDHDGTKTADRRDAADLYRVLEKEVAPLYYERDRAGLPRGWIARMKNAMATIPPVFNTHRQVKEYFAKYYLPAMRKG